MSRAIVLDVSVALTWCFEDVANSYGEAVLDYLQNGGIAVTPSTCDLLDALGHLVEMKKCTLEHYLAFSKAFNGLPHVVDHAEKDAIILWREANLRVPEFDLQDVSYLELACRRGIPLATVQSKLRAVARQLKIPIFLEELEDWQPVGNPAATSLHATDVPVI